MVVFTAIPGLAVNVLTNRVESEEFSRTDDVNVDPPTHDNPAIATRWIESPSNADVGIRISFYNTFKYRHDGIRLMVFVDNRKLASTTIRPSFLQNRFEEESVWHKLMESVQRKKNGQVVIQTFKFTDVQIGNPYLLKDIASS